MMSPAPVRKAKKGTDGQNIKVFVRVRPINSIEKKSNSRCLVSVPSKKEVEVEDKPFTKKFSFDRAFDKDSKQVEIYNAVAKPLVDEVLSGFNCTIFAYGQTGTGKTYTMEGDSYLERGTVEQNAESGIIPRCVNQIFDELKMKHRHFTVRVSFIELYNEELFDLLSPSSDLSQLKIQDDRNGSCIIKNLEEIPVKNQSDVYRLIEKGSHKRQTAATMMNAHSSRSHSVFTITVRINEITGKGEELITTGKLNLVDLAGSENIGRSGAVDKRAREAGNINQSLLTLGRVITSLVEKAPHVPYRESKLTRLLQDALGGRTKTSIIATVSPSSCSLEETSSTLDYAHRAKNIKNRPETNKKQTQKEAYGEISNELAKVKKELADQREKDGCVNLTNEAYAELIKNNDNLNHDVVEKMKHIKNLEDEMASIKESFEQLRTDLDLTKDTLQCTQKLVAQTAEELDDEKSIVTAQIKTEFKLTRQGEELKKVATEASSDVGKLHDKIDRKRKVEYLNEERDVSFTEQYLKDSDDTNSLVAKIQEDHKQDSELISDLFVKGYYQHTSNNGTIYSGHSKDLKQFNEDFATNINNDAAKLCSLLESILEATKECKGVTSTISKDSDSYDSKLVSMCQSLVKDFDDTHRQKLQNIIQYSKLCEATHNNLSADVSALNEQTNSDFEKNQNHAKQNEDLITNLDEEKKNESKRIKELEENMKQILEEREKSAKKRRESFKAEKDVERNKITEASRMLEELQKNMEIVRKNIDEAQKNFITIDGKSIDFDDNHKRWSLEIRDDFQKRIEDIKNKTSSKFSEVVGDLRSNQSENSKVQLESREKLLSIADKINDDNSDWKQNCTSFAVECEKDYETLAQMMNKKSESISSENASFTKQLNENVETIGTQCGQLKLFTCEAEEKTVGSKDSNIKTLNERISKLDENLHSKLDEETSLCTREKERSDRCIMNASRMIQERDLVLDEGLFTAKTKIDKMLENVHDFFDKQVKDIPTGMTPMRRNFSYPTDLAKTSPHVRIVARRRRAALLGSKIPLPNFNQEDDLSSMTESGGSLQNLSTHSDGAKSTTPEFTSLQRSESFKDSASLFREPFLPPIQRQESKETISSCPLSRSSSTSSIDSKENISSSRRMTKKRELKVPSNYNSESKAETRSRKILGSHN